MAKIRHEPGEDYLTAGYLQLIHTGSSPAGTDTTHDLYVMDWQHFFSRANWTWAHSTPEEALAMAQYLRSRPAILLDVCWECILTLWRPIFPRFNIYRGGVYRRAPGVTLHINEDPPD